MLTRALLVLVALVTLSACVAPSTKGVAVSQELVDKERDYQFELTLQQQLRYQRRLDDISWPLLKAALPLCEQSFQHHRVGLDVMSLGDFPKEYRPAAKKVLSMGDYLQVVSVIKGSAAEKAGLQEKDVLKTMNGAPLAVGKNAGKRFAESLKDALANTSTVRFGVERNGKKMKIAVEADKVCNFPVYLTMSDAVNAYADGKRVVITKGMLRFTETDLEISTVVAHELAHNMMEHINAKKSNYWLGTLADIAAIAVGVNTQGMFGQMAASAYSQDFETEADYVGMYILALADMEIEAVANFWRRMAVEHPGGIAENHGASHPSTPERFLALEKTAEEIRTKQRAGFPLVPDRK